MDGAEIFSSVGTSFLPDYTEIGIKYYRAKITDVNGGCLPQYSEVTSVLLTNCDKSPCSNNFNVTSNFFYEGNNLTSLCLGDSVILLASGGDSYLWSNGSTDSSILLTPEYGNFEIGLTIASGEDCFKEYQFTTQVKNCTCTFNAGPDVTLTCTDSIAVIGNSSFQNISSVLWSPSTGLSDPNIASPIVSIDSFIQYTVFVQFNDGCIARDTVNVIPNVSAPQLDLGSNKTITCSNPSVIIGTESQQGYAYDWTPKQYLSAYNVSSVVAQPGISTSYHLKVTDISNGCVGTDSIQILVNKTLPIANAGLDKSVSCTSPSVQIGVPPIANQTYTWLNGNGLSSTTISQPIASPNQTETYILKATNVISGCISFDTVVVISINNNPQIFTINEGERCGAGEIQLSVTATSGAQIYWYPDINSTQPIQNAYYYFANVSETTDFYAQANLNGCLSARKKVTAKINSPSEVPIVTNGERCGPGYIDGMSAETNYSWINAYNDLNETQPFRSEYGYSSFYYSSLQSTKVIYVEGVSPGCPPSQRVPLTALIKQIPPPPLADNIGRCGPGEITIHATPYLNSIIKWYSAPAAGYIKDAQSLIIPNLSTTTTYYARNSLNNCLSTATAVTANISPTPSIESNVSSSPICRGTSLTISPTITNASEWSIWNESKTVRYSLNASYTATPEITTKYLIEAKSGFCTVSQLVTINVNIPPSAPSISDTGRCNTGYISLVQNIGSTSIKWYDQASGGNQISTAFPQISSTTTFYAESQVNGCKSLTRTPVIFEVKTNPIIQVEENILTCHDLPVLINPMVSNYTSYEIIDIENQMTVQNAPYTTPPITESIFILITASNGFCEITKNVAIQTRSRPSLNDVVYEIYNPHCSNKNFTVELEKKNNLAFDWYLSSSGGTKLHRGNTYTTPNLTQSKSYYVGLEDQYGCKSSGRAQIVINYNMPCVQGDLIPELGDQYCNNIYTCPCNNQVLEGEIFSEEIAFNNIQGIGWNITNSQGKVLQAGPTHSGNIDYFCLNSMYGNYFFNVYREGGGQSISFSSPFFSGGNFQTSSIVPFSISLGGGSLTIGGQLLRDTIKLGNEFIVFPNPATDKIVVQGKIKKGVNNFNFQIFDLNGRAVKNAIDFNRKHPEVFEVDIEDLEVGVYIIFINDGQNSFYEKFIKY